MPTATLAKTHSDEPTPAANIGAGRSVLLIAYHFPPFRGSSGVQRTLRFAQHLPKFGWRPIVLSVAPFAYPDTSPTAAGNELPPDLEVHRAFGLDTGRHLSLFGRFPLALALPDRWVTWRFWAVRAAQRIIRERNVSAIWSTFPIATAHRIGLEVARRTGLPWIAEFRDPMWQGDYPPDPRVNSVWRQLETEIFAQAQRVVVVTPSAATVYRERFRAMNPECIVVVQNGYDEETFARAEQAAAGVPAAEAVRPLTLLHSGLVYPSERDPTQLFAALAALKARGTLSAADVRIVFRASGNDRQYRRDLEAHGLTDIVHLEPAVSYLAALQELLTVDGLLLLQAANCNAQIPAKLYEYLRAGRPILALTDPQGDTATTLHAAGCNVVARLDSQQEIEAILPKFLAAIRDASWPRPSAAAVASYSREAQTGEFARLLADVAQPARR